MTILDFFTKQSYFQPKLSRKMVVNNRRDAGYTIISRFEEGFRSFLHREIESKYLEFYDHIPHGIILKANERNQTDSFESPEEFFENIDFPDLKEIALYKDHFSEVLGSFIDKADFIKSMDELYGLRCKIAHVKGYFTSIDLDKLVECSGSIAKGLKLQVVQELLDEIRKNPHKVIIKIPNDFVEDYLDNSGIINNIPVPDYEYEGGFVGRDEDRKKISYLLKGEKFPVITLIGSGGVGKTALALKVIQDLTENPENKIFEAIVWLSAKENKLTDLGIEDIEPSLRSFEELLDTIIGLFDFKEFEDHQSIEQKEAFVDQIFELIDRMLIVIDNLETINDPRIINFIFDSPMNVKFLITSRKGIGQVERRHEVKELKTKEAIYLFRQIARDKQLESLSRLPDETIKTYTSKVSYYPLAIKWVVGQVARGKNINSVISSIHNADSDISRFCYEQIFSTLSEDGKKVLYTLCLLEKAPNSSVLEFVLELDSNRFEDVIEDLILVSLVIPEQFQNERKEISTKYSLLELTRGYTRGLLNKNLHLREDLKQRINQVESTITTTERAKREYKHSLYNFGAKSDEEKIATIIAQTAFQKYQSGQYEEAVDEYKRAIKIAPNFAPIYRNWAIMESYEDHLSEAEQLMEKASKLDSKDPQIYLIWGNIYRKKSRYQDAHKKYQTANNLAPEDPIILNALGQSMGRLGEFESADRVLREALNSKFDSVKHEIICRTSIAENLISWGEFLQRDRDYASAEDKFDIAVQNCISVIEKGYQDTKIFNALSKANLRRGMLFVRKGNEKGAIQAFEGICKSKGKSFKQQQYIIEALLQLGEIHKNRGRLIQLRDVSKKLQLNRGSDVVRRSIQLQERIQRLVNASLDLKERQGSIVRVEEARKFVIIKEFETGITFLGFWGQFLPPIVQMRGGLLGEDVSFCVKENKERSEKGPMAIGIQLIRK